MGYKRPLPCLFSCLKSCSLRFPYSSSPLIRDTGERGRVSVCVEIEEGKEEVWDEEEEHGKGHSVWNEKKGKRDYSIVRNYKDIKESMTVRG